MHKIDGFGATAQGQWTEGDPATSTPATHWTPEWANDTIQECLTGFIESRGIVLDKGDDEQFQEALDDVLAATDLAGRPNLLRNGSFLIHQFATATTQGSAQTTLAQKLAGPDGWRFEAGGNLTSVQVALEAHTIGQTDVPRAGTLYLKWTQQTASDGTDEWLETRTDNLQEIAGEEVTLSFYGRLDAGTTSIELQAVQDFGPGGSTAVTTVMGTHVQAAGWARFESTATIPSISGKTLGTRPHMKWRLRFTNDTGTFTVSLDNIKLERAPAATPYLDPPTGVVILECLRYFQASYDVPSLTGDRILPVTEEEGHMAAHQQVLSGSGLVENLQAEFAVPMDHEPELAWVEPQSQGPGTIEFPNGIQEGVTGLAASQRQTGYPDITSPPVTTDDVANAHFWCSAEIGEADGAG